MPETFYRENLLLNDASGHNLQRLQDERLRASFPSAGFGLARAQDARRPGLLLQQCDQGDAMDQAGGDDERGRGELYLPFFSIFG